MGSPSRRVVAAPRGRRLGCVDPIATHELGGEVPSRVVDQQTERVGAEAGVDAPLAGRVAVLSRDEPPGPEQARPQ
jgi:hypothetical protein